MNIFYLAPDPFEAARFHCDQHVGKMLIETAQMLSTAHRATDNNNYADKAGLYKAAYANHPSCRWVRESSRHYWWALQLACGLAGEFSLRYHKNHKTASLLTAFAHTPPMLNNNGFTEPPQCFGDQAHLKQHDTVAAYRAYYLTKTFATWKTNTPEWVTQKSVAEEYRGRVKHKTTRQQRGYK